MAAPSIELPRLRLRVIAGGRGKGPGRVEAYRDELADREAEAIAVAGSVLELFARIRGVVVAQPVVPLAVVSDVDAVIGVMQQYLEHSRSRAALIDPPRSAA